MTSEHPVVEHLDAAGIRSVGELAIGSSTDPKLTFGPSFFILIGAVILNLFSMFYHLTTCNKRKFEEL